MDDLLTTLGRVSLRGDGERLRGKMDLNVASARLQRYNPETHVLCYPSRKNCVFRSRRVPGISHLERGLARS